MKATYIGTGARDDDLDCTIFGRTFRLGETVDLTDPDLGAPVTKEQQILLQGNPTFETDGDPEDPPGAKKKRGTSDAVKAAQSAADAAAEAEDAKAKAIAAGVAVAPDPAKPAPAANPGL